MSERTEVMFSGRERGREREREREREQKVSSMASKHETLEE